MMEYILITGGVTSGIGKGCLSAILARLLTASGTNIEYQKIEPCLQNDISSIDNTQFGEIICENDDIHYDSDVGRVRFFTPNFIVKKDTDLSFGNILRAALSDNKTFQTADPKLSEIATLFQEKFKNIDGTLIVEIGGTSGELEHNLMLNLVNRSLGKPISHLHITTIVNTCNRLTSKPAQVSINNLVLVPDIVFVRNASYGTIKTLEKEFGNSIIFIPVEEDSFFPEKSYYYALTENAFKFPVKLMNSEVNFDDTFQKNINSKKTVIVIHDGAGVHGYQSLYNRLIVWSQQQISPIFFDYRQNISINSYEGIIFIGETYFDKPTFFIPNNMPVLDIRFKNKDQARKHLNRPDWHGNANFPEGGVFEFVKNVLLFKKTSCSLNAYDNTLFAEQYIKASELGNLRDHNLLDNLIWKYMPNEDQLRNCRILDVGSGTGRWSEKLVSRGALVVGIEPAEPMHKRALAKKIKNFKTLNISAEHFESSDKFDVILASMSLDHCNNLHKVFLKLSSFLTENGRFIISTEHPMRTAATEERWSSENKNRKGLIYSYDDEGKRNYFWFGNPTPVIVYHHKIETWVNFVNQAGLRLTAIHEPVSKDKKDAGIPRFWLLVADKLSSKCITKHSSGRRSAAADFGR